MKVIRMVAFDTHEAEVFARVHRIIEIGYPKLQHPDCTPEEYEETVALRACARVGQQVNIEKIRRAIRAVDNVAAGCLAESSAKYWDQKFRLDPTKMLADPHAPLVHDRGRVAEAMSDVRQMQLDETYAAQDLLQTAYTALACLG